MQDTSYISEITLNNFRNHKQFTLKCGDLPVVILGRNGVGKTNILEAISLLSPGRGLRSAQLKGISYHESIDWAINANILKEQNICNVGVGSENNKKVIKIDHKIQNKQIELIKVINLIWLTPQMNTIFIASRKGRLNFFDRIVFSFDANHARNVSEYEHAKQERAKLLRDRALDDYWLSSLEAKMAKAGMEIAKSRIKIVNYLQERIDNGPFSCVNIMVNGDIEELIKNGGENCEEIFINRLKEGRNIDMLSKKTNYGTHKSDFNAHNKVKNMAAALCSTGEQKLMLIAIILAAIKQDTILLLDDVASHLDSKNRTILFSAILEEKCQAWITDTNPDNFTDIKNHVQMFSIQDAK